MWIYILLLLITLAFVKIKFFKSRVEKLLLKVPGEDYHFLFGNAGRFLVPREEMAGAIQKYMEGFSNFPLCRIWIGNSARVGCLKASSAEAILTSSVQIDKAGDYDSLVPWLGTGLLTSTGAKWHSRRKLLTPTFHFKILEDFLLVINEQANVLIGDVLRKREANKTFDVYPLLCRCTLDTISETAMGVKLDSQHEANADYVNAVNGMGEVLLARVFNIHLQYNMIYKFTSMAKKEKKYLKTLHSFTKKVIENRKKERKSVESEVKPSSEDNFGVKKRLAFLDLLLDSMEAGNQMDNAGIQEEVDTFMFEGHDTTASGLAWILYNLGRFPHFQEKVYEELREVVGECSEDTITSDHLRQLKFLERFIKESMRLFPPVPFYSRKLNKDTEIAGYTVPKGVMVLLAVQRIQTDPENWPDPLVFDPDRFLPENSTQRSPFSFVSFSAGPRNCIGQKFAMMELKVVIAKIVQEFQITSMQKFDDLKFIVEMVLRPVGGLQIQLKKRNSELK